VLYDLNSATFLQPLKYMSFSMKWDQCAMNLQPKRNGSVKPFFVSDSGLTERAGVR
jgi:hypothetical protein